MDSVGVHEHPLINQRSPPRVDLTSTKREKICSNLHHATRTYHRGKTTNVGRQSSRPRTAHSMQEHAVEHDNKHITQNRTPRPHPATITTQHALVAHSVRSISVTIQEKCRVLSPAYLESKEQCPKFRKRRRERELNKIEEPNVESLQEAERTTKHTHTLLLEASMLLTKNVVKSLPY